METRICCVYNATRGCRLSSTVTAVDSAREPLMVLKILVEGLARDGKSGLWLTPLAFAPSIMRLFPFDFAYLNSDLTVREAVALLPGIEIPQFNAGVAGALILPLETFSSTGTCAGDRLVICEEAELQAALGAIAQEPMAAAAAPDPVTTAVATFTAATPVSFAPLAPVLDATHTTAPMAQGIASTMAMGRSWQVTNSTALPMTAQKQTANATQTAAVVAVSEEEIMTVSTTPDAVSDAVASTVGDSAPAAELAASQQDELVSSAEQSIALEPDAVKREAVEAKLNAAAGVRTQEPAAPLSGVRAKSAPALDRDGDQGRAGKTDARLTPPRQRAEKAPVPGATATDTGSKKAKKETPEKKESLGVLVKRFLNCEDPLPERRAIIRLVSQGLVAYTGDREKTKPCEVRDVSPDGLYLRTQQRWRPGQVVLLLLERRDATEADYDRRVGVQVKVMRCDQGGVGLIWVWPQGVEFNPWRRVHTKRSDETDAEFFLRELRLSAALGYFRQVCPSALDEIKLALHQRLSNKRVASAVEIALQAQALPGRRESAAEMPAHPDMVRRIVENGSWTEDNWIRHWWAGLLASSCSPDGLDTSNSVFIDMLAKLTTVHLRVLSFVCRRSAEMMAAGAPESGPDVYCTSEELIEAVGSHSLARIQQTMGQLSSMSLIAESSKPSYVAVTDKVKTRITPTTLGLKLHARCNGLR